MTTSHTLRALLAGASLLAAMGCAGTQAQSGAADSATPIHATQTQTASTYEQDEIVASVAEFFGITAEAAAEVVERAFRDNGRPTGFIRGEELSAALGVGVRYGEGNMQLKNGQARKVFWQGPSIGFDTGANASKVFTLVYGLADSEKIYQRFPGVEGSAYLVGGLGVSYQRADNITLAPLRAGVGLRAGANVGYQAYSRERNIIPL
jgi:hypothetical protein